LIGISKCGAHTGKTDLLILKLKITISYPGKYFCSRNYPETELISPEYDPETYHFLKGNTSRNRHAVPAGNNTGSCKAILGLSVRYLIRKWFSFYSDLFKSFFTDFIYELFKFVCRIPVFK
jgi:hypothetical protein